MNDLPRQKLFEIVKRYGHTIVEEPRRCEGLMRDYFPAQRREIAVLTAALEQHVPAELLQASNKGTPRRVLLARLAERLHDEVAMEEAAAMWAVRSWAFALEVISADELRALEAADAAQITNQDAPIVTRATPSDATTLDATRNVALPPQGKIASSPQTQPGVQSGQSAIRQTTHAAPAQSPQVAQTLPNAQTVQTAQTLIVAADRSGHFLTISEAINYAPAGARLLVRPGIYHEGFVLDKQVEIIGDGALEEIVVRATASSCLVMQTDQATVRNLTLRGQARTGGATGAGFYAVDIPHGRLLLEGCDISSDSLSCVAIHNPTAAPTVRSCRIHHSVDSGVYAFDWAQVSIEACDIFENTNVGVAVTGAAQAQIKSCHIHHGSDAGIVVWDRATSVMTDCDIYQNRSTGVGVNDEGVVTARDCRIHDGENTGIFVHERGEATFERCNVYRNGVAEVAVISGGNVSLRECKVHQSASSGVVVRESGHALLETCDVFNNRASGIEVDAGGVLVARGCRINDNGHVGISCDPGGAASVENCDLTENRVAAWETHHGSHVESRNNRL